MAFGRGKARSDDEGLPIAQLRRRLLLCRPVTVNQPAMVGQSAIVVQSAFVGQSAIVNQPAIFNQSAIVFLPFPGSTNSLSVWIRCAFDVEAVSSNPV